MSIISEAVVVPNRVRSIYQWLLNCKNYEEEEDKLKRFLIPASYKSINEERDRHQVIINPILSECEFLGLIIKENEKVALSKQVIENISDKKNAFQLLLADLVFRREHERNDDFATAVAWILSIDPFKAPKNWTEFEPEIKRTGCEEITGITNSNPYSNFIIWSTFLGFSWAYQGFVPDPTEHLSWRIQQFFKKEDEVPISHFLDKMKEFVPVIDGGIYRQRILDKVGEKLEESILSPSLSLALKRLQDLNFIRLEKKSDIASRALAKEFGSHSFSHIIVL